MPMRSGVSVSLMKIRHVLYMCFEKWAIFALVCLSRFILTFPMADTYKCKQKELFFVVLTRWPTKLGSILALIFSVAWLRGWCGYNFVCFVWPPHGIFILAWRSGLGKRPSDDHHHHSLRGRLAQCKPSMSSTVRTFFGVKQLRSPPSRPQSGYVCQRQTTKVKDKIQTHYTSKEWRQKKLGWPSSPQQQREAPPNMLLFFGTKS